MNDSLPDPYVQRNIDARDGSAAVQKAKLAHLRSKYPELLIFAFEGIDDKTVYYHWLNKIAPTIAYESMICKNKPQLLQLFDVLKRDKTGLDKNTFFFLDKDFDDLQGRENNGNAYVTSTYSIENFLVNEHILNELLKVEMHCNLEPELREKVIRLFNQVYLSFLSETKDINFRIFIARKNKIRQVADLPSKLNQIVSLTLNTVTRSTLAPQDLVILEREPSSSEISRSKEEFSKLDPTVSYRGKFALQFFKRWLDLLASERFSLSSDIFSKYFLEETAMRKSFNLDQLAAKSKAPDCLYSFVRSSILSNNPSFFA